MKLYKLIIFILIVFFKTGNLLSNENLFSVNNIQLNKNEKTTHSLLTNQAFREGFYELINKILLEEDVKKLSDIKLSSIKNLVTYYKVSTVIDNKVNKKVNQELVNYNITFDKEKIHDLFYKRGISYSEISNKELYILPILINKNEIFIFNNNFFYDNWNSFYENDLIEFILPLENIEIIQKVNITKNNLLNLNINDLFQEYKNKNLAIILIEDLNLNEGKIYIKANIQGKIISKNLKIKNNDDNSVKRKEKIIIELKKEFINIVKSQNLIDIRTPSFLNVQLNLSKKSSLVELNSRIKKIDLIENIFVQEFNKDHIKLKIKYLGKLDKIINRLKFENIYLELLNDKWIIKTL